MSSIEYARVRLVDLKPYGQNPRKHSENQLEQVAKSISEFGFINPIVIDTDNIIVAGHGRFLAAGKLGLDEVPVIKVEDLTEAQLRAYRIADNKLTDNSTWDEPALRLELEYLDQLDMELDVTGFEVPEIDLIFANSKVQARDAAAVHEMSVPDESKVVPGDLFLLGRHRVICGDCRDADTMATLMEGREADAVCADAPYNVKINGHVLVKADAHDEFAFASGEMSQTEFTEFLRRSFASFYEHSKDGSVHFLFMDWRHMSEMLAAGNEVYDDLLNLCVWTKHNSGMGSLYRSQHELVFVFKKGGASHTNNVQLGRYGRNRSNVWSYSGMNSFGAERDELLASHPTVKPVSLVADAILDVTPRNGLVLDGFLGSGTTIIAAEQIDRVGLGCEISPQYVEVAIKRFQAISEEPVIHMATGLPFEELVLERQQNAE